MRRQRRLHLYEHGRLCKREGENRVFGFAGGGRDGAVDVDEMRVAELVEHPVKRGGRDSEFSCGVDRARVWVLVEIAQIGQTTAV